MFQSMSTINLQPVFVLAWHRSMHRQIEDHDHNLASRQDHVFRSDSRKSSSSVTLLTEQNPTYFLGKSCAVGRSPNCNGCSKSKKIRRSKVTFVPRAPYFSLISPSSYSGTGGGPIRSDVSLPDLTNNGFWYSICGCLLKRADYLSSGICFSLLR